MLVPGGGSSTIDSAGTTSSARLSARVVDAAQRWAAALDAAEEGAVEELPPPLTADQLAQRDLRDAVHDLEWQASAPHCHRIR